MKDKKINIGIIGTGRIAKRITPFIKKKASVEVVCVYNPNIVSAKRFAEKFDIQYIAESLDEITDKIDAVYIASPNETHFEYTKFFLKNSIHVLCEKPMAFRKDDALELFCISDQNEVVLMEAVKTAFLPGFRALVDFAVNGEIGEIVDMDAAFTRITDKSKREFTDKKYGGSFTEFGTYGLLAVDKIYSKKVTGVRFFSRMDCDINSNNIDTYTRAEFDICNEAAFATIKTGIGFKTQGDLTIAGSSGYLYVPAPWWLTKKIQRHYEEPSKVELYEYPLEEEGFFYEIEEFISRINGNKEMYFTSEDSIFTASYMEKFLKASGRLK